MLRPIGYCFERGSLNATLPPLSFLALHDQACMFEDSKMFRDSWSTHLKRLSEFAHGMLAGEKTG